MRRVLDFLRLDDLPPMTRPNYRAELRQIALWGIVGGVIEGNIAAIVASKTFGASQDATNLTWALPTIMMALNLVWGVVIRGRPRVPTFAVVVVCGLSAAYAIGYLPAGWPMSPWIFAALIGLAHLFLTALTTLRTTIWQLNYPVTHRARITGRLTAVRTLLTVLTGAGVGLLFDKNPSMYRWVYPLVAVIGVASLIPLRHMRVRGEKRELRRFRSLTGGQGTAQPGPLVSLWQGLREARGILRSDRPFAQYMGGMFLLGSANFFTEPLLINWLTKRLHLGYFSSTMLIIGIPTIATLIGLRYWAPLYDRVGVLRFRISNSVMWMLSYAGLIATMAVYHWAGPAYLPLAMGILVLARIMNGMGNGGGTLAWNLGHLHFARPHQTELYMGIHVGLTGVRAMIMPSVGSLCSHILGDGAFTVALSLAFCAFLVFRRMDGNSVPREISDRSA